MDTRGQNEADRRGARSGQRNRGRSGGRRGRGGDFRRRNRSPNREYRRGRIGGKRGGNHAQAKNFKSPTEDKPTRKSSQSKVISTLANSRPEDCKSNLVGRSTIFVDKASYSTGSTEKKMTEATQGSWASLFKVDDLEDKIQRAEVVTVTVDRSNVTSIDKSHVPEDGMDAEKIKLPPRKIFRGEDFGFGRAKQKRHRETFAFGIENNSNTCFMNSVLQALFNCDRFLQVLRVLQGREKELGEMNLLYVPLLLRFLRDYVYKPRKGPGVVPVEYFEPILLEFREEGSDEQEDAAEFLEFILSGLASEMELLILDLKGEDQVINSDKGKEEEGGGEWIEVMGNRRTATTREVEITHTPFGDIFTGRIRSSVLPAGEGSKLSVTFQPFYTLHLDVSGSHDGTLEGALASFFAREEIVKEGRRTWKQNELDELPSVLVLNLKRYRWDGGESQKITSHLKFELELVINNKFLSRQLRRISGGPKSHVAYELFAVIQHRSKEETRTDRGHYITFSRCFVDGNRRWALFNDQEVILVSKEVVLESEPYLLFYHRKFRSR